METSKSIANFIALHLKRLTLDHWSFDNNANMKHTDQVDCGVQFIPNFGDERVKCKVQMNDGHFMRSPEIKNQHTHLYLRTQKELQRKKALEVFL